LKWCLFILYPPPSKGGQKAHLPRPMGPLKRGGKALKYYFTNLPTRRAFVRNTSYGLKS
jgi:hypothetical protein